MHFEGESMGIQTHFDRFHDRIKLGRQDDSYKKARERDDSITDQVKDSFREEDFPVIADFIQGSLATNTAIVPIEGDYDIDRALVIDAKDAPSNPVTAKKTILDILEHRGFKNAKIKMPCVTADYLNDNLHIDFVVYKKSGGQYYLAVGKRNSDENNREWSAADPRGLIDWINDNGHLGVDATKNHEQFRRLVRYLKRWRDFQFSESVGNKVFSIGLTVMAREQFQPQFTTEGFRQDLVALRGTVSQMLIARYFEYQGDDQYIVRVSLPIEPWRDIFFGSSLNTGTQFRNKLKHLEAKLLEAEGLDDVREQCEVLNKLFGDDFVVPDPPKTGMRGTRARWPSAGLVGTSQGA